MPRQMTVSDEQEKKVPRVDLQIGEHPDPPGLSHPVLPIYYGSFPVTHASSLSLAIVKC